MYTIGCINILGEHVTAGLTPPFDQSSIFSATTPSPGGELAEL
jgi:hypothetical protein